MNNRELFDLLRSAATPIYGDTEAAAIARLLMEDLYGVTRLELALHPERGAAPGHDPAVIASLLAAGRPVQYITGRSNFCGLELSVDESVLIPRPETEELVGWIAAYMGGREAEAASPRILDLGTGSGAIAIALARLVEGSRVTALDISPQALEVARRNAANHAVRVDFRQGDVLGPLGSWEGAWAPESFDAIVSNPPYIPESEKSYIRLNVTGFEPHIALFVPEARPLLFYEAIADHGAQLLRRDGTLWFEVHEDFADDVVAMLRGRGYAEVELRRDLHGRKRMVKCQKR